MRYIGNKTKLLSFIGSFLDEMNIRHGRALDAFAGTAAVGSYLKARGFAVDTCDVLSSSYVFQRAYVTTNVYPCLSELNHDPSFHRARSDAVFRRRVESRFGGQRDFFDDSPTGTRRLDEVLVYLDTVLSSQQSFITREFSSPEDSSGDGRMYFTEQNAQHIDAIRLCLQDWLATRQLTEDEFYVLLAALLEAADRVANTTGVYAAFVKTWQSNARRSLLLTLPAVVPSETLQCRAFQGDINTLVSDLGSYDLLYLDPPYNTRQYSSYYHVPEIIAEGWHDGTPPLRGKTGLIPDDHKKSMWSTRRGCVSALETLLERAEARHVLMSYNNEGIIPEAEIERIFKAVGVQSTYRRVGQTYKRYRADSDSDSRQYTGDVTTEFLYYIRLR